jgi:hypothetical protein
MNKKRETLFAKVRALLAKTVENGCTEAEAMAALELAQRLMAENEISEADLAAGVEDVRVDRRTKPDREDARDKLYAGIGAFCHCRAWKAGFDAVSFAGLDSEVIFAHWLLDMLADFVERGVGDYMATARPRGSRRQARKDFVHACCIRITKRLYELAEARTPKGKGLVVAKHALIDAELAKRGIELRDRFRLHTDRDRDAAAAGWARGADARFDRPVAHGGPVMIGDRS